MERRKILFVINPVSGQKDKEFLPDLIQSRLNHELYEASLCWWENVKELEKGLIGFVLLKGWAVVAVGGDGTVNLITRYIQNTETGLIILPMGSGNGLARQLGYSSTPEYLLQQLNDDEFGLTERIDLGRFNEHYFANVAGIGFDGEVAEAFSKTVKRGLRSYAKVVLKLFPSAPSFKVECTCDHHLIEGKALIVSVANGSQWGNNVFVARNANLKDGLLDLILIEKPRFFQIPSLLLALRFKREHKLVRMFTGHNIRIKLFEEAFCHVDGEPIGIAHEVRCEVVQSVVKVLRSY